jgi:hypothetical protein
MPCDGVHKGHFGTGEAATIVARLPHHEVQMC